MEPVPEGDSHLPAPAVRPAPQSAPTSHLTLTAVARRLGIAPATLRTWERRYGIGPAGRTAGARRRYAPSDLARLENMSRLIGEGVAPADAAQAASPTPSAPQARPGTAARAVAPGAVRGLNRAASTLDQTEVLRLIRGLVATHGIDVAWEEALCPALAIVGDRWASNGEGVEVEHLLSEAVATVLREEADVDGQPRNVRPVLLTCTADELHSLPLHVLAASLAGHRVACRILGAALPDAALLAAVRQIRPAVVFVWAMAANRGNPDLLGSLPSGRPATTVLVGGGGWDPAELPASVGLVGSLAEAREAVLLALGL